MSRAHPNDVYFILTTFSDAPVAKICLNLLRMDRCSLVCDLFFLLAGGIWYGVQCEVY